MYSCVFTCFRFASTLNMLLCLLLCAFVSSFQSSSMFPYIDFSPVCEFLAIVHTAKTGLLSVEIAYSTNHRYHGDSRTCWCDVGAIRCKRHVFDHWNRRCIGDVTTSRQKLNSFLKDLQLRGVDLRNLYNVDTWHKWFQKICHRCGCQARS